MVSSRSPARRWISRAVVILGGLLTPIAAPSIASAHPLGNFTINMSAGIVLGAERVEVDYVVDMAEIPTFQERPQIDGDGDGSLSRGEMSSYAERSCRTLARGIAVEVDGESIALARQTADVRLLEGQAGLSTLRLTCRFEAAVPSGSSHEVSLRDGNYPDRIGWHEVTAVGDGTTIVQSDVPSISPSDRLRSYQKDVPTSDVRSADVSYRLGGAPLLRAEEGAASQGSGGGLLADLVARPDQSVGLIALMIVVAIGVGALHALGPGHGKSLIGAYLAGNGGAMRHVVGVGAAVSVMHTASVLGLGLLVLSAERVFSPDRVYPWLGLASGLVALGLGAALLVSRIHAITEERRHGRGHPHPSAPLSRRGLIALAFSGGILPSPSALVVLLGSISIGRTALGLVLIAAFSVGLATSLVGVGAIVIRGRMIATNRLPARLVRLTPVVSAACIAVVGLVLTVRGLSQL
jgi:ABC-type nickel/cobalt efflux system permease component RcnA